VARNVNPLESAVISVTQFHGGTAFNIIPERVKLSGTVRTFKQDIQESIREKLESILAGITSAHGARYILSYKNVFPVTYNHKDCIDKVLAIAEELVGSENVVFSHPPDLGSEDFAYYSQKVPACFIFLGSRNDRKGIGNFCHHPQFDVDEECMLWGMALYAGLCSL
jgi:amidohydrolase